MILYLFWWKSALSYNNIYCMWWTKKKSMTKCKNTGNMEWDNLTIDKYRKYLIVGMGSDIRYHDGISSDINSGSHQTEKQHRFWCFILYFFLLFLGGEMSSTLDSEHAISKERCHISTEKANMAIFFPKNKINLKKRFLDKDGCFPLFKHCFEYRLRTKNSFFAAFKGRTCVRLLKVDHVYLWHNSMHVWAFII